MTSKQLSDRIGNIDDRLVQQAEQSPNNGSQSQIQKRETFIMCQKKRIRSLIAVAAVIALMACSFCVGAAAYAKEVVVEVPMEQETITLEEIGLTLILPDSWKDKYGVELSADGTSCAVYVKSIHDGSGDWAGQGYLFWVCKAFNEPMTPEELYDQSPVPCIYIFSTVEGTYSLNKASDVQYPPDTEWEEEYLQMAQEVQSIRFVADNVLK